MSDTNPPLEKHKFGSFTGAIWKHEGTDGPFYTASAEKRYKDDAGTWQTSASFTASDLDVKIEFEKRLLTRLRELERAS